MLLLHILIWLLFLWMAVPAAYLAVLTLAAALAPSHPIPDDPVRRMFAVLIPAHDEEGTIARTVLSAAAADYPRDRVDVVVVADNCTDRTAEAAAAAGATVLVRTDPSARGKGHALRWGIGQLLASPRAYEAVVVIDADSTMTSPFLRAMNAAVGRGGQCLQATDIVAPGRGSWSAEMIRLSFLLFNVVRPLGRKALGLSVGLRGNGMCFTADLLRRHPWSAYSRAEDAEYGLQLLAAGIRTEFVPDAVVHAVMPQELKNAESQRARWEGGRAELTRAFAWPMIRNGVLRFSWTRIDAGLDLLTPPLAVLTASAGAFWLSACAAAAFGACAWGGWPLRASVAAGCMVYHVLGGLAAAGAGAEGMRTLLQLPRYLLWKAALYLHLAGRERETRWVRTTREP